MFQSVEYFPCMPRPLLMYTRHMGAGMRRNPQKILSAVQSSYAKGQHDNLKVTKKVLSNRSVGLPGSRMKMRDCRGECIHPSVTRG